MVSCTRWRHLAADEIEARFERNRKPWRDWASKGNKEERESTEGRGDRELLVGEEREMTTEGGGDYNKKCFSRHKITERGGDYNKKFFS